MEAIRQLSDEMKEAADILGEPGTFNIGSATSYMKGQFVRGKGLLSLRPKGKAPTASVSSDDDSGSDDGGSDDEYKQRQDDESSDDDYIGEDDDYDDAVTVEWLNNPRTYASIDAKYMPKPMEDVPGMRPEIRPYAHQAAGATVIVDRSESGQRGIVVADLPGLGKTLQVIMAFMKLRKPGDGPCVVVCPTSCVMQWKIEASKFFYETSLKTIVLTGEPVPPTELFKYDLVITSYSQVVSELVRYDRFLKEMKAHKSGVKLPKRPTLTLFSGIFTYSTKLMGKMLVLDEAQTIKNPKSRTFAAIEVLREYFDSCVMLTGTPLDNTWKDAYTLLKLLRNHPIFEPRTMIRAFVLPGTKNKHGRTPKASRLVRYMQALDAVTIRRPQDTIQAILPPMTMDVVRFHMDPADLINSNEQFAKYLKLQKMAKADMSALERAEKKSAGFGALMKASHWTNHPALQDIVKFERDPRKDSKDEAEPDATLDDLSADELEYLQTWRARIAEGRNWRSPRVDCIVETINKHRDWRPDDAFVVMDESVYFLDILEIALTKMSDPVRCFRYDGRDHPARRASILDEYRATPGQKVLLASRGTGGVGLNLQCANVLIMCRPLWKSSWHEQAEARVWRAGQDKPVFIYNIEAKGFGNGEFKYCEVENYKKKKRDQKHKLNSKILGAVTRKDDVRPPRRECF